MQPPQSTSAGEVGGDSLLKAAFGPASNVSSPPKLRGDSVQPPQSPSAEDTMRNAPDSSQAKHKSMSFSCAMAKTCPICLACSHRAQAWFLCSTLDWLDRSEPWEVIVGFERFLFRQLRLEWCTRMRAFARCPFANPLDRYTSAFDNHRPE